MYGLRIGQRVTVKDEKTKGRVRGFSTNPRNHWVDVAFPDRVAFSYGGWVDPAHILEADLSR